jgi:hypothetical protein
MRSIPSTTQQNLHIVKLSLSALLHKVRVLSLKMAAHGEYIQNNISRLYVKLLHPEHEENPQLASEIHLTDCTISLLIKSIPLTPLVLRASCTTAEYEVALSELCHMHTLFRSLILRLYGHRAFEHSHLRAKVVKNAEEIVSVAHMYEQLNEVYWLLPVDVRFPSHVWVSRPLFDFLLVCFA